MNQVLSALPAAECAQLSDELHPVQLNARQVLASPHEAIQAVYFPRDAVASMLVAMEDGRSVQGCVIGNEGMTGVALFLGQAQSPEEIIVQIPGQALSMSVDDFRAAVARSTNLHRAIQNYTLALISQLARTAACNSVHGVDLRLARWLLMSHDRAGRDRFPVTHEFAAMMLGVRRATVTKAAGAMHQAGLISYRHGQITILDRAALEAAACEDYRISRATYARLYAQPDPA